jgi:hypothetical protein
MSTDDSISLMAPASASSVRISKKTPARTPMPVEAVASMGPITRWSITTALVFRSSKSLVVRIFVTQNKPRPTSTNFAPSFSPQAHPTPKWKKDPFVSTRMFRFDALATLRSAHVAKSRT